MPERTEPIVKAQRQGQCFLCGPPASARHRLWDAIDVGLRIDRLTVAKAAENWDVDPAEVRWVKREFSRARRLHRPLPGRTVFA